MFILLREFQIFFITEIQKRILPPRPPAPKHSSEASSPSVANQQQKHQTDEDTLAAESVRFFLLL